MRGRKPKPVGLQRLHGNPGKRAIRPGVPEPAIEAPEPPAHLSTVAREEWERIAPQLVAMGVLSACDRAALSGYCSAWARHVRAEQQIAKFNSELVSTPNGSIQISPWVSISSRALELMHKFLIEFGLTPASRVRLGQPLKAAIAGEKQNAGGGYQDSLDAFLAQDPETPAIN